MTMKVFLGFQRKPAKSPSSSVARAFGMTEQPTDGGNWIFAKGRFRVSLEDLRHDLQPENREWADEVGWAHNWAVSIAVHHRGRTDIDYIKWHSLVAVIMEAYELNLLWTDSGTDTPQYNMRLNDFMPSILSEQGDDLTPDEPEEIAEEVEEEAPVEVPDSVIEALKAQLKAEMLPEAEPVEKAPLELKPVESDEQEEVEDDEEFDAFDDWDDSDDEEVVESEEPEEEIGPITDWD